MIRIAHIINPVKVSKDSDLFMAQPITFESMRVAQHYAHKNDPNLSVQLLAVTYQEDDLIVPSYFNKSSHLTNSIKDKEDFLNKKKLPFIAQILEKANQLENVDYVVFSNVDISLYPDFYCQIKSYLDQGFDGLCINRNTLPNGDFTLGDLETLYQSPTQMHEGIDCFVFSYKNISKFNLEESIVGSGPVGLILAMNLICFSNKFAWIREGKATFHIGDDKNWMEEKVSKKSLLYFNNHQLSQILNRLLEQTKDSRKRQVLEATQNHVQYFLNNFEYLGLPHHRVILANYSDRKFVDITKVLNAQRLLIDSKYKATSKAPKYAILRGLKKIFQK